MFVDEITIETIPELTRDAKDSRSPVNTKKKKKVSINPRSITQDRERTDYLQRSDSLLYC